MDKILILDFGSQSTQLIGRRIRELGVYTEILAGDSPLGPQQLENVRGIVLSGSPDSVYTDGAGRPDSALYELGLPILGICYGLQRMLVDHGGRVEAEGREEAGKTKIQLNPTALLQAPQHIADFLASFGDEQEASFTTWMSHSQSIAELPKDFIALASSSEGNMAIVAHSSRPWLGLQFHPELSHCQRGQAILGGFVFGICKAKAEWHMQAYVDSLKEGLIREIGDRQVLLLISGGVDSTVAGALLLKTHSPDLVHLMYMDTGLMRKNETEAVKTSLEKLGAKHVHIVHCEGEFLAALAGHSDPEAKRKIIGDLFIKIQEREVAKLNLNDNYLLAQGTLYTDLIESGKGVGNKAKLIKSHHNVGSPLVAALRKAGRILEPLDCLYKDEVRALGRLLNVDEQVIVRHPFPGPGLGVRIVGEVTKSSCDILREADAIYIDELKQRGLYEKIWQAFAVLLPIRSVGVVGDSRKYGRVLVLRAILSEDGMSADVYPFDMKDLLEISTKITNQVPEIGRVSYDISSKPPATIEWE